MSGIPLLVFICGLITTTTAEPSQWPRCRRNGSFAATRQLQLQFEPTLNRYVFCDTQTDGGGWIIFQRRIKGDWSFYREWNAYVNGFGRLTSDHWLGLKNVNKLTSYGNWELRIDVYDNGQYYHLVYPNFRIEGASENYKIQFWGAKTGNLEDSKGIGIHYSNNTVFSTYDKNNALRDDNFSCPRGLQCGWWFKDESFCTRANLNGIWRNGLYWRTSAFTRWLLRTKMMIRRY
ncbi:hypothetical protein RRG08_022166 [Elysia crispata]|uniref:Fibrinogen C-terminal domain-containing protein n=1 Tax=Elysia crispata TaxID=231223 RepID=A0AAE1E016_9GAST|nr:hypothetical protein RRG08_022166 [Elysia crispata]